MENLDLNARFNILVNAVLSAQKKGILTLDEAVQAKSYIDKATRGEEIKESLNGLKAMCMVFQSKGLFSLEDAHVVFLATDNLDEEIEKFTNPSTETAAPEVENTPTEENGERKVFGGEFINDVDESPVPESPATESKPKPKRKKKSE